VALKRRCARDQRRHEMNAAICTGVSKITSSERTAIARSLDCSRGEEGTLNRIPSGHLVCSREITQKNGVSGELVEKYVKA
jgi:hypothetical protein